VSPSADELRAASRERRARVRALREAGATQRQIAELLGVSPNRVGQLLKREGLTRIRPPDPKGTPRWRLEKLALNLFRNIGADLPGLVRQSGLSPDEVLEMFDRHGTARPIGSPPLPKQRREQEWVWTRLDK